MVKYENAKLYKIIFPNGEEFIGTTTKKYLSQRKTQINYIYKKYVEVEKVGRCPPSLKRFYELMHIYGTDSYDIVLIDCVECHNKDELNALKMQFR